MQDGRRVATLLAARRAHPREGHAVVALGLILGPGGFRFGDCWRLGWPLQALVAAIAIPLLLLVWPL